MKCELRVSGGARAGHREVFDKPYIGIGRHPLSDLRFDAEQDIDASTRHAAIVRTGDQYVLRDLNSTNGTFLNGERLTGEHPLKDGDTLKFGVHGPQATFHLMREEGEEVVMPAVQVERRSANRAVPVERRATPSAPAHAADVAAAASRPTDPMPADARLKKEVTRTKPERALVRDTPESKTGVLRAEIHVQRSRYRTLAGVLVLIVLGAVGIVVWQGQTSGDVITTVAAQRDSVIGELAALRRLQAATDAERQRLELALRAEADTSRQRSLRGELATVERRSVAIQQAQEVDYTAIRRANDAAVAMIFVRFASDTTRAFTGTAFSINSNGQMLTNKHVVMTGHEVPLEIAIRFSGSREVHPARLVRVAPDADLALVQLESAGPFPQVAGISTAGVIVGAPVASLGYPGGGDRATLVTGSVTRVAPDSLYEFDSFSGIGASGSPIFDRDGRVVAVLFGGLANSGGRAVLALPIARAMRLLN